jgi:hypothetical protein
MTSMTLRRMGDAILTTVIVVGVLIVLASCLFVAYLGGGHP